MTRGIVIAQGVDCAALLVFGVLVIWRGWSSSQRTGWSPRQNMALLIGGVTFTMLLLNLTEARMGESFATISFSALLVVLTLRWQRLATAHSPGRLMSPDHQEQRGGDPPLPGRDEPRSQAEHHAPATIRRLGMLTPPPTGPQGM